MQHEVAKLRTVPALEHEPMAMMRNPVPVRTFFIHENEPSEINSKPTLAVLGPPWDSEIQSAS